MLNKRAHVLLSNETWLYLENKAAKENVSINELIRRAIDKTYKMNEDIEKQRRKKLVEDIKAWRKIVGVSQGVDYKEMIEHGRRY